MFFQAQNGVNMSESWREECWQEFVVCVGECQLNDWEKEGRGFKNRETSYYNMILSRAPQVRLGYAQYQNK